MTTGKNIWIDADKEMPVEKGEYNIRAEWGSLDREVVFEKAYYNGERFEYGFDWCRITHWRLNL